LLTQSSVISLSKREYYTLLLTKTHCCIRAGAATGTAITASVATIVTAAVVSTVVAQTISTSMLASAVATAGGGGAMGAGGGQTMAASGAAASSLIMQAQFIAVAGENKSSCACLLKTLLS
jgi:hypothetical protein